MYMINAFVMSDSKLYRIHRIRTEELNQCKVTELYHVKKTQKLLFHYDMNF